MPLEPTPDQAWQHLNSTMQEKINWTLIWIIFIKIRIASVGSDNDLQASSRTPPCFGSVISIWAANIIGMQYTQTALIYVGAIAQYGSKGVRVGYSERKPFRIIRAGGK
jgi:hypothetical protein